MVGALVAGWRKKHRVSTVYNYRCQLQKLLAVLHTFGAEQLYAPKVPPPSARATVVTGDELIRLLKEAANLRDRL